MCLKSIKRFRWLAIGVASVLASLLLWGLLYVNARRSPSNTPERVEEGVYLSTNGCYVVPLASERTSDVVFGGTENGRLLAWKGLNPNPAEYPVCEKGISSLATSASGKLLAVAADFAGCKVFVYSLPDLRRLAELQLGDNYRTKTIVFSQRGDEVFVVPSSDATPVVRWKWEPNVVENLAVGAGTLASPSANSEYEAELLSVAPDEGTYIARRDSLFLINPLNNALERVWAEKGMIWDISICRAKHLIAVTKDDSLVILDSRRLTQPGCAKLVTRIAGRDFGPSDFSRDGTRLAVGSACSPHETTNLYLFDTATWHELERSPVAAGRSWSVLFAPNNDDTVLIATSRSERHGIRVLKVGLNPNN